MNACFIHIPKNGGRSVESGLNLKMYRARHSLINKDEYSGLITFGHQLITNLQKWDKFDPEGWFLYTFVRNPFDRLVSIYAFGLKRRKYRMTFDEFCEKAARMPYDVRYNQVDWIHGLDIDFIGRFENFEDDFRKLCGLLGVGSIGLPHVNATRHRPWQEYYTDKTADFCRSHYREDFETFGYEYDLIPDRQ